MEDDGFQLVSRKKSSRASTRPLHYRVESKYEGVCTAEILTRINDLKQVHYSYISLVNSTYYRRKLHSHQFFKDTLGRNNFVGADLRT